MGHRFEGHDCGKEPLPLQAMLVHVGIARRRKLGVAHQFDGILHARLREKTARGQQRQIHLQRRRLAEASGDDERHARRSRGDRGAEKARAFVRRNGGDAVLEQRIDAPEFLAHAEAGPHAPFEAQALAVRMRALVLRGQRREPGIGQRVVGFAGQPDARDDRAEGDEEAQVFRVDGSEQIFRAADFGRERFGDHLFVEHRNAVRDVAARAVDEAGDRAERALHFRHGQPHGFAIRNIDGEVAHFHARSGHAFEILAQLRLAAHVGAAENRERRAGLPRQLQRTFGGDALAAAADEHHVVAPERQRGLGRRKREPLHDRFAAPAFRVVVDFGETDRRQRLGGHPFRGAQIVGWNGHHAGRQAGRFAVQRAGEGRAVVGVMLDQNETRRAAAVHGGLRAAQEQRDAGRAIICRQAQHDAAAVVFQGAGERFFQGVAGGRENRPGARGQSGRGRGARAFDEHDAEGFDPRLKSGRRGFAERGAGSGALDFREGFRDLPDGGVGETGEVHELRCAETPRRFGHELADGDRVQVQVAQHAALVLDCCCWQFHLLRHHLADDAAHVETAIARIRRGK